MIESGFENKSVWGSSGILVLGEAAPGSAPAAQLWAGPSSCGGTTARGTATAGPAGSLLRAWALGLGPVSPAEPAELALQTVTVLGQRLLHGHSLLHVPALPGLAAP